MPLLVPEQCLRPGELVLGSLGVTEHRISERPEGVDQAIVERLAVQAGFEKCGPFLGAPDLDEHRAA